MMVTHFGRWVCQGKKSRLQNQGPWPQLAWSISADHPAMQTSSPVSNAATVQASETWCGSHPENGLSLIHWNYSKHLYTFSTQETVCLHSDCTKTHQEQNAYKKSLQTIWLSGLIGLLIHPVIQSSISQHVSRLKTKAVSISFQSISTPPYPVSSHPGLWPTDRPHSGRRERKPIPSSSLAAQLDKVTKRNIRLSQNE